MASYLILHIVLSFQSGGFVAHLSIPIDVQTSNGCNILPDKSKLPLFTLDDRVINQVSELLSTESFAIWVGFGARNAAKEILQLAERTGAAVMSSPRGKGIFPENHPQYLGVTGFAGHESVLEYMKSTPPERILVLGTRLGEFTSFWNPSMIPQKGFIHVDIDSQVPGAAYPNANTFPVVADVKGFLNTLLEKLPRKLNNFLVQLPSKFQNCTPIEQNTDYYKGLVRPQVLMETIQRVVVEGSNAIVIAEAGNSFAWTTHHLKFNKSRCWRVSTGFGAMGHATTGVVGAAIANCGKAVAIVGDGAMLMNQEINTAVQYQIPAVWIILNDGNYNMCTQGNKVRGYDAVKTQIPLTDFVMLARSMGGDGISVESESQLNAALSTAMSSRIPFVVDVKINPTDAAPIGKRINCLIKQSAH
jgi:acetolactate synthase I/II/III large subunit